VPFSVLAIIVEKPGVTAAEIRRQLVIQRANIVPILAELESRGLFVREADPEDQRIQRLHATKAGRTNYADWLAGIQAHEEHSCAARLRQSGLSCANSWRRSGGKTEVSFVPILAGRPGQTCIRLSARTETAERTAAAAWQSTPHTPAK
jgi:hypothetical protein